MCFQGEASFGNRALQNSYHSAGEDPALGENIVTDSVLQGLASFWPILIPAWIAGLLAGLTAFLVKRARSVSSATTSGEAVRQYAGPATYISAAILAALLLGYVAVFSALSIQRHESLQSNAYDLAIFDQAIWNTSRGHLFDVSIKFDDLARPILLGDHFSPALILLAPVFWIWNDVRALLIIQSMLLALGAVPVFLYARRLDRFGVAGLAAGVAYLLSPTLHYTNLYDFHEVALATPILAWVLYFFVTGRYRVFLGALILLLLCKEELAFVAAGFGGVLVVQAVSRSIRERRPQTRFVAGGAALLIGGLIWGAFVLGYVIPAFEGGGAYTYVGRYGDLGDTPGEVLVNAAKDPLWLVERIAEPVKIEFAASFFAPFALLSVLAPDLVLLTFPTFGYLLISTYQAQYSIGRQYGVFLIPIVVFAALVGLRRLLEAAPRFRWPLVLGASTAIGVSAVLTYLAYSPGPFTDRYDAVRYRSASRAQAARDILKRIPETDTVSAQENLAPHLSHRRGLFLFPSLHAADWVVIDNAGGTFPVDRGIWDFEVGELVRNPLYEKVADAEGIALFKRRPAQPDYQTNVDFNGVVSLAGFDARTIPGNQVEIRLYWQVLKSQNGPRPTTDGYRQVVRLQDQAGKLIAEIARPPRSGTGFFETGRGIDGEIILERYEFPAPATAPLQLQVLVRDEDTGAELKSTGAIPQFAVRTR